ncbi:MAG: hypothetical protein AAFR16_00240 [Pseudomonadota bacterium]
MKLIVQIALAIILAPILFIVIVQVFFAPPPIDKSEILRLGPVAATSIGGQLHETARGRAV